METTQTKQTREVPALFAAVIGYINGCSPALGARFYDELGKPYVVVSLHGKHFERQYAQFTPNGVQWCASVFTVDERGERRPSDPAENIGTGVAHDEQEAPAIGDGIIRSLDVRRTAKERAGRELNFKRLVAAFVEAEDPTLEPEVSHRITQTAAPLCVRVRLRANKAGVFEEVGGVWVGQVQTLGRDGYWSAFGGDGDDEDDDTAGELEEEEDGAVRDVLTRDSLPALDYGRNVEEGAVQARAAAILALCRQYRETHGEPEGEFREYFDLPEKFYNGGGGNGSDWRACFWIEEGARFVIYRKGGEPPLLYPVGRSYQGVEPVDALYQRLRPLLKLSGPRLREFFTEEQGDPLAVIEELVGNGLVEEDDVIRIMRDLKKPEPAEQG